MPRKITFNTAVQLGMNPEDLANLPPHQRLVTIEDTGLPVPTVTSQVTTLDTIDAELLDLQARMQVLMALKADIQLALGI